MKEFIIIGNQNAIAYKEIFPYIKENVIWLGVSHPRNFVKPNRSTSNVNACWFTNIPHKKRNTPLDLYKRYSNEYPKYDNYDAIEVSKVSDIPMDYDGVMGVPISFLDKYCPKQFEILGLMSGAKGDGLTNGNDGREKFYVNGKGVYSRILIRKRNS